MTIKEFGPIELDEIKSVRFDFASETDVAISNPTVSVEVLEGTDASPAGILVDLPVVVGLTVVQKIQPQVAGCTYKVRALVNDASGLRHGVSGKFTVTHG